MEDEDFNINKINLNWLISFVDKDFNLIKELTYNKCYEIIKQNYLKYSRTELCSRCGKELQIVVYDSFCGDKSYIGQDSHCINLDLKYIVKQLRIIIEKNNALGLVYKNFSTIRVDSRFSTIEEFLIKRICADYSSHEKIYFNIDCKKF